MSHVTRMQLAFAPTDIVQGQVMASLITAEKAVKAAEETMNSMFMAAYLNSLEKLTDRANYIREYMDDYLESARKDNGANVVRGRIEGQKFVLRAAHEDWYEEYTNSDYMVCIKEMLGGPNRPMTAMDIKHAGCELILGYDYEKEQWRMLSPLLAGRLRFPAGLASVIMSVEVAGDSFTVTRTFT